LTSVGNSRYVWATVGISRCDGRDMPTVTPTIPQIATVVKIEAESWQNPPNLDNQFLHRWMWYSADLKTVDFKTEKKCTRLLV
jgi:hypothetical protein